MTDRATPTPKIKKALVKSTSLMLAIFAVVLDSFAKHLSAFEVFHDKDTNLGDRPDSLRYMALKNINIYSIIPCELENYIKGLITLCLFP